MAPKKPAKPAAKPTPAKKPEPHRIPAADLSFEPSEVHVETTLPTYSAKVVGETPCSNCSGPVATGKTCRGCGIRAP